MEPYLRKLFTKHQQFITYALIGGTGATLDYISFLALFNLLHIDPSIATVISVSLGIVNNFILNIIFNFRVYTNLVKRFVSFYSVGLLGIVVSIVIIYLLHNIGGISANIAKLLSIPIIVVLQYTLNKHITFNSSGEQSVQPPDGYTSSEGRSNETISPTNKQRIVIIGGGYTGIAAAYTLAKMGHKVEVLEKGSVLGGLTSSFTIEGAPLERAYHHIFKTDTDIINLAKELGVNNKIKWHDSSISLYYGGALYPFKGAIDLLKFKPLSAVNRLRAGLIVLYLQQKSQWKHLQHISAYKWMRRAAGEQVTNVIWEPLLKGKFDAYYNKVSMAWLWARIHVRARSREATGEKLGYFDGGFQVFTNTLVDACTKLGVTFKTNVELHSIGSGCDGSVIVKTTEEEQLLYNACIATIPSNAFANLVEKAGVTTKYLSQLRSMDYIGARVMVFSSSQKISPYYWHNINDIALPFLVFINHTQLVDKSHYGNQYVYYLAAYLPSDHILFRCSKQQLKKKWFTGLEQIFPDFDNTKVRELHVFNFTNAQHIVDTSYDKKMPDKTTPIPNVYLSNFSQIFPEDRGTNYAIRDGIAIAKLVANKIVEKQ